MSNGQDEAAEARRIAREQAFSPQRVLAGLDRVDFVDSEFRQALDHHRDELLPGLREAMAEESGARKLNASVLLLELGESSGTTGLLDLLAGKDREMHWQVLHRLSTFSWNEKRGGYQVPLDQDATYAAIDPFLDAAEIRVRDAAVRVLGRLDTTDANRRLARLISHPEPEVRIMAVHSLSRRGEDGGCLAVLEDLLFRPGLSFHDAYRLAQALQSLAERGDADIRESACRIAIRYVRSRLHADDNDTANLVWFCFKAIAAAQAADERALLLEVLQSKLRWWARGIALKRLAELEGEKGVKRLCDALRDWHLREAAAEGLAECAHPSSDADVLDALAAALGDENRESVIKVLLEAIMVIGGAARPLLEKAIERAEPEIAMSIYWLLNGIDPKKAARKLAAAGVVAMPSREQLARYKAQWIEQRKAYSIVWNMLGESRRLIGFDCKTGDSPADHASLVRDFSEITGHTFEMTDVSQAQESEDECKIRFIHDGRGYSFIAENMGRYYDLRSVLEGLNGILESLGREERFFQLRCGGVIALILFAPEKTFLEAARDLRIPLELDPDAARRSGMAYMNYVLSTLKGQDA
jgi:HEAT repeat protein